jgi:DNA-binding response OmpR family regulator
MHPHVLLVESDPDFRLAIADALAERYDCDAVASEPAALLKIREENYAYILVDVDSALPMNAVCDALAADPALLAKVVIISDGERPAAMMSRPLLLKPFDRQQLLERLS